MAVSAEDIKKMMAKKHRFMEVFQNTGRELDNIIGHTDPDCIAWYHCHCDAGEKIWEVLEMLDKRKPQK